jgi:hypothetical protein
VIPEGYVNSFKEANAVFRHARVYDANMPFILSIAEGRLDPITMEDFDEFPQIPSSLGHQAVYANETASFQNQSRELKIKKDGGPFVLLSEKTQDEFCA